MEISTDQRRGVSVVTLAGRLDSRSAAQAQDGLEPLLAGGADKLLLDLSGLEYISSAGLRVLLHAAKRLDAAGGRLVMCGLTPYVREVFQVVGFTSIFEVHQDCDRAWEGL